MSTFGSAAPRGRVPQSDNAPPPLWLGLTFALGGFAFAAVGLSAPDALVFVAGGLFFALIGVALTLTTLRAGRARIPVRAAGGPGAMETFTRSPMRILVDLVLAPLGGLAFLAFSVLFLEAGPMGWIGTAMFVFFGVLVLRGSAVTVRRGWRRAAVEVGANGIWTHELPRRLAWDEIERLEVEAARGAAGDAGTATYRRLGIWPRDRELASRAPGRGVAGMVRAFAGFANSLAPGPGLSDPEQMAPFGISAFEIEQDFADVLRSVGRYASIVGVPDAAAASLELVRGEPVPPAQLPDTLMGAILENMAEAAGGQVAVTEATAGTLVANAPSGATVAVTGTSPGPVSPRMFLRRPRMGSFWKLLDEAWGSLVLTGIPILILGSELGWAGEPLRNPLIWVVDLFVIGLLAFGIGSLLELPARWRMLSGDPTLAMVDEQGLELRGMGRLPWSDVAGARVVRASLNVRDGSPEGRRLEILPRDRESLDRRPWSDRASDRFRAFKSRLIPLRGRRRSMGAFALDLDLVDDPAGLLDAIAAYRTVDGS